MGNGTYTFSKSESLIERASKFIPGGVNSPVRAFTQVGGVPRFITSGKDAFIQDVDGNKYVDFIGSWGPIILGHAAEIQINAIKNASLNGTSFGAPTESEVKFAELLCNHIPGMDMIRLVSSGTEAAMSAVRLARAFTGRDKIIKFNGCYHGHADVFLVQAGSGVATQGISGSPGVLPEVVSKTISIEFNDLEVLKTTLNEIGPNTVAAIVVEPVPGNMGLVLPENGFLQGLRAICDEHGITLLFDEVMSGFRVGLKGASGLFNVVPDLYCFGKVIGGGLPLAAFGGSRKIMEQLAPLGPVYQAGTLSGNPLAVSAGLATIEYLIENNPYAFLESRSRQLMNGMKELAEKYAIPFQVSSLGSMFGFFFSEQKVTNFTQAKASNIELFKRFFHAMLEKGVYFAPSAFEAGFIGIKHSEAIIAEVLDKVDETFQSL